MATQRVTVLTLGGTTAEFVIERIQSWRTTADLNAIDSLCGLLRLNGDKPSVLFFDEWVDGWLMGDALPGPGAVLGREYQITYLEVEQVEAVAEQVGTQWVEQKRYASRLREAAGVWSPEGVDRVVVVIRLVVWGSYTNEEIVQSMAIVPEWLEGKA